VISGTFQADKGKSLFSIFHDRLPVIIHRENQEGLILVDLEKRGTIETNWHFAILQARSSRRNGPLVPALAGGNPCT
jgi:hypothetical protein